MNKDKIIKKSSTFTTIINNQQSVKNKYFSIYYVPNDKTTYGITVPKKVGKAHIRNKLKRQLKNIIITNEKNIQNNFSYVIIVKEATLKLQYQGLKEEFLKLIEKVRN